jgi:hypothetical protein
MSSVIADPRVLHYWDQERVISDWYKSRVDPNGNYVLYDTYFLYDGTATWEPAPQSFTGWGGTIFGERGVLETAMASLIAP